MGLVVRTAVALAFAGALVSWSTSLRADEPARISGIVLNDRGEPIVGALVTAQSAGSSVVRTTTDRKGFFALLALDDGASQIDIVASNYGTCFSNARLGPGDDVRTEYRLYRTITTSGGSEARRYTRVESHPCSVVSTSAEPYDRYVLR